jgi:pimeloyl-ACP methyl ester carboxylesterase
LHSTHNTDDPYLLASFRGNRPPAPEWFREALSRTPARSYVISADTRIELLTWGTIGRPGLLFLHGNGAHADWWSHIAPFFASDWRCAAISFSGMGRSERRAGGYTVNLMSQEASDAFEAAGLLETPAAPVIVGHSFGGIVGLATAARDRRCGALILIDTPLNLDHRRLSEASARAPKPREAHQLFATVEEGLARFRLSPPQETRNAFVADRIARDSLVPHAGQWSWHFDPRRVTLDPDQSEIDARNLRCPVAFIYGERSALVPPDTLIRTLTALPPSTPSIGIPDAAHHVLIDQPLALVSALRGLLVAWPSKA